jgi:hypothetical protein
MPRFPLCVRFRGRHEFRNFAAGWPKTPLLAHRTREKWGAHLLTDVNPDLNYPAVSCPAALSWSGSAWLGFFFPSTKTARDFFF